MYFLRRIGFVGGVLLSAGLACAQTVTNGSFESGTGTDIDNWVLVAGATGQTTADYAPTGTGTSPYGSRFLALNFGNALPGGSATQDLPAFETGQTYRVTFAYAQFGGAANDQTLAVTINTTSAPLLQQVLTDPTPGTDFATIWERASFDFVGNGFASGITFADTGVTQVLAEASDLLVDDVSITIVPEPASLATLGVASLVAIRRRRRRPDRVRG